MSFLEDEILELDVDEVLYNYQNYGVTTAIKYGLCKAIKNGYNHFMVSFIDTYNFSLKTTVVNSNNYSDVIINSNEFIEISEKYYYNVTPGTNLEVGVALLNVINELFIKCVDYVEKQTSYYLL